MKPKSFEYAAPTSLDEALTLLSTGDGDARVVAGGQSLVPMMNFRLVSPSLLIDLNRIPELRGISISLERNSLRLGSMTRHSEVEYSTLIARELPLLKAAMSHVAHTQIRNRGTIGGSLAHSDPSAEWPALCVALDALIHTAGVGGVRESRAKDFFVDLMTTALEDGEIITSIEFQRWLPNTSWGFTELARRRGDFAVAGVVALAALDPSKRIEMSRIVLFGVADFPILCDDLSAAIAGRVLDHDLAVEAGEIAASTVEPRADLHVSSDYRRNLVSVLTRDALLQVLSNSQEDIRV